MTDHCLDTAPASDDTSLMAALAELNLPGRLLKDLAADPDHAGELLMESAADLDRAGRGEQTRRVLEALREHPPTPEDGQYASIELAKILRESQDARDGGEAERIISELLRPGHLGEGPAQLLGEDLHALERWEEALRCYNIAARQLLAEPPEELADEEDDLSLAPLLGRLLARMKTGLTPDAHDEVAMAVAERQVEELVGFPGEGGGDWREPDERAVDVEALYSREAFAEARSRGMLTEGAAEQGADAYYRAADVALRERARAHPGTPQRVVLHGVEEVVGFAGRSSLDPAASDTALTWVDIEINPDDPRRQPWPPARNEVCWCASGRKYKKCCGSPANR